VEEISADEMLRAKALIETDELGSLQRVAERADRLSMYATLLDEPDEVNRQLERYLAVTAPDVRRACGELLGVADRAVLTYVPQEGGPGREPEGGDADEGSDGPLEAGLGEAAA